MDTEIELLAADHNTLVHRRKQHILPSSEIVDRHSQQSMIPSRIAGHQRGVAVRTCLVRKDNLPFQRIFQVYKFGLVEF